jgi:MFS family permease
LHWRALREFPTRYWFVVAIGATFTLARFSEAFLVLRAHQTGLDLAWIPSVIVVMSLACSLSAYPVGVLSDRLDRRLLLALGMAMLIADYVIYLIPLPWEQLILLPLDSRNLAASTTLRNKIAVHRETGKE